MYQVYGQFSPTYIFSFLYTYMLDTGHADSRLETAVIIIHPGRAQAKT